MKHKSKKIGEFYKNASAGVKSGSEKKIERTRKSCDRCGDGTFMAEHKDRFYCGKCGMTVWKKKG